jgi:D-lyxose ketol-isomerase
VSRRVLLATWSGSALGWSAEGAQSGWGGLSLRTQRNMHTRPLTNTAYALKKVQRHGTYTSPAHQHSSRQTEVTSINRLSKHTITNLSFEKSTCKHPNGKRDSNHDHLERELHALSGVSGPHLRHPYVRVISR